VVRSTRLKLAATGGVNTKNPAVGVSGKCRPASRVASLVQRPAQFTTVSAPYCEADAGHTIADHGQVYDADAADDFRAMAKPRGRQHGMRVDYRIEPTLFREKRGTVLSIALQRASTTARVNPNRHADRV
jgi:hypothetical protein